ncbi:hypothetical protein ONZ43_g921 [Nemania bipapillata]|uniref:Uncharacterized protein n=1 Tax=Nemania bipapillata TaxID=110536 RepID=A0ACC2J6J3_9PEZI|nr:hypothetical protein ONZ43_g921 [Nemania bipapillata]
MMDAFLKRANPKSLSAPQKTKETSAQVAEEPPNKKVKREVTQRNDLDSDEYQIDNLPLKLRPHSRRDSIANNPADDDVAEGSEIEDAYVSGPTAIESSLPEIKPDKEAIEEYYNFKASQGNDSGSPSSRLDSRAWVRGKSSLYVDAFNLALDTVLDEEAHLFDDKERRVFEEWRYLGYEAQFLYVRLFLRKTSSWHRISRLSYYNDITDTDGAVKTLQKHRDLPRETSNPPQSELNAFIQELCIFKDSFTFADASEDFIDSVEEAVSLLGLDELKTLAKEAKVQGKNKADLAKAICKMSSQQAVHPDKIRLMLNRLIPTLEMMGIGGSIFLTKF